MKNNFLPIEGHIHPAYLKKIEETFYNNPFASLIGIEIDGLSENYCRLSLTAQKKCANPYGCVHGGVLATLADIAMGVSMQTIGLQPVTAELTMNYLSRADLGGRFLAEGRVIFKGAAVILCECTIKTGDRVVALGKGIFTGRDLPVKVKKEGSQD
ncbi:MAG TPA: PaaI family thioesterase [Bacillota bacterium]|nr:PaaI family thioesterase [Bacillota bacterium]